MLGALKSSAKSTAQSAAKTVFKPQRAARVTRALAAGLPPFLEAPLRFLGEGTLAVQDQARVARVEQLRAAMVARAEEQVRVLYSPKPLSAGTEATADLRPQHGEEMRFDLKRIATHTSVSQEWGTFLYLCAAAAEATTVIELGACAGVSGAYLAAAPSVQRLVTIEGSADLAALARENITAIDPRAEVINALFDDALDELLPDRLTGIDFAWIDGHHEKIATLHYFQRLRPALAPGALVLFDDISWSQDMRECWGEVCRTTGFAHAVDLGKCGVTVWDGGGSLPRQWDLSTLRGLGRIMKPNGWK